MADDNIEKKELDEVLPFPKDIKTIKQAVAHFHQVNCLWKLEFGSMKAVTDQLEENSNAFSDNVHSNSENIQKLEALVDQCINDDVALADYLIGVRERQDMMEERLVILEQMMSQYIDVVENILAERK